MKGKKVTGKQKKIAKQDSKRITKDSKAITKDIRDDRFLSVRANARDIDQSLKSLDKQMEVLDNAKNQVRNNRVAYSAINSQRGILNQQKQQLKLLKRNRKMHTTGE